MIIDTSALLAILFDEPDGPTLLWRIAEAPICLLSSANAVEVRIVADRHANSAKGPALDALLETLGIDIRLVTIQHARLARTAYHTYGKGQHLAGLNTAGCPRGTVS
jgi:ribonuclease VapC